jgi:predicted lipoprotein with Yx(FWY)xxD motif
MTTNLRTRTVSWGVAATAIALVAAACGSSGSKQAVAPAGGGSSTAAASAALTGLASRSTSIGTVLTTSKGLTVYELVGDTATNPACAASCEAIWPPVMKGGSIVVVHGHPTFTFTGDMAPGDTHGQNAKDSWGTWLALNPSGQPVAAVAASPTSTPTASSSSASGGGYGY